MVALIAHSAETVVWCSSAVKLKDSFYLFNRINQKLQALKQDASIENTKRNLTYTIKYENVDILIVHISIETHFLPPRKNQQLVIYQHFANVAYCRVEQG